MVSKFVLLALIAAMPVVATQPAMAQVSAPSRASGPGCVWEERSDPLVGLGAWVQRCDLGARQIHFEFETENLAIVDSDKDEPTPVVLLIDLQPDEKPVAAIRGLFDAGTEPELAARCDFVPVAGADIPERSQRYTFVPSADYQGELDAKGNSTDVDDLPCGDWGASLGSAQYFETQTDAPRVMFVRAGQDAAYFDAQTLEILRLPEAALIDAGPEDCCGFKTDDDGITADFLMETCSVPGDTAYGMVPNFDCQSYVLGMLDTIRLINSGNSPEICLPHVLTAGGVLGAVTQSYSYEADGLRRASDVLVDALKRSFACTSADVK